MQLTEKYRPREWNDVAGQEKIIRKIETIRKVSGLQGKAFWITGQSGTGKTTIARIIASEVSQPWSTIEIDGRDVTNDFIRDIDRFSISKPIGAPGWCIIINEAHGIRAGLVKSLNTLLEHPRVMANVTWICTTTVDGNQLFDTSTDDANAFLSRCTHLELSRRDLTKAFAARARDIAQAEGIDGQPIERYERLLKDCRNNLRAAIQQIESGAMLAE